MQPECIDLSFNSKLVRLKVLLVNLVSSLTNSFQFQTGSIKSDPCEFITAALNEPFQFQTGSIKSVS